MKRFFPIILFFLCIRLSAQETGYGPGFQALLMNNPGLAGAEGAGRLRLTWLNFLPGRHYNLNSFYASYDSYFPALHGGAGVWLADDYIGGIVNDLRGGLAYSYYLQAGKDLFIHAGLSASLYHRGYDFGNAILPDQIDPLGGVSQPSSENLADAGKTIFDTGAGIFFIYRKLQGGFALNHLAKPGMPDPGNKAERLEMKLIAHAAREINLDADMNLIPLGYLELQGSYLKGSGGATIETRSLSLSTLLLQDNSGNTDVQAGFSLKTFRFALFYNYRFNIRSTNNFMPFSLLHQTGLAFSLNNVNKRINIKTIRFPDL